MVIFVFLCFEEYIVELSETENYCRMGKQPLKNRRASLQSDYRSCEFSSCGLLKIPFCQNIVFITG